MRLSHDWSHAAAVFDDENLVSCAGLVPVMELAEQTGLSDLLDHHVVFRCERIRSGAANSTPKLTSVIAGLLAGADSIDDLDLIRAGGMKRVFGSVYDRRRWGFCCGNSPAATSGSCTRCSAGTCWP